MAAVKMGCRAALLLAMTENIIKLLKRNNNHYAKPIPDLHRINTEPRQSGTKLYLFDTKA